MVLDQLISQYTIISFGIIAIIALILKGYALWLAARSRQLAWFIALLILNTLGVLPVIYLIFFRKQPR